MSAATRRKGLKGEREVADRVQDAGWELRGRRPHLRTQVHRIHHDARGVSRFKHVASR